MSREIAIISGVVVGVVAIGTGIGLFLKGRKDQKVIDGIIDYLNGKSDVKPDLTKMSFRQYEIFAEIIAKNNSIIFCDRFESIADDFGTISLNYAQSKFA